MSMKTIISIILAVVGFFIALIEICKNPSLCDGEEKLPLLMKIGLFMFSIGLFSLTVLNPDNIQIQKIEGLMMELQEQLSEAAEEKLKKIDVPDAVIKKIQEQLDDEFKDSAPAVDHLYDEKELAKKNKEI